MKLKLAYLIAALGCTALPSIAASLTYAVQTVSFPGDNFTQLLGINDASTIVGYHGATVNKGFTLTLPANFTDTNFPNSAQTQVTGVSGVAGNTNKVGFYVDTAGATHGFISIPGLPAGIGPFFTVDQPGTAFNQVLGISDVGSRIAGYSSTDPTGMTLQRAYIGTAGLFGNTFTDINALLPTNQNSQATGINTAGNAVGFYLPTADTSVGFLDTNGVISAIDPFGSTFTQALGISQAGEIVGFYVDGNGVQHGYTEINGVFSTFDPAGSVNTTINGVNDLGQLVGFATINDNVVGFVASPVPEPATWGLLGIAGIALIGVRTLRFGQSRSGVSILGGTAREN
jgi:hypothetical protein